MDRASASGAEGRRFDSFRGHMSNIQPSRTRILYRRVLVFGLLALATVLVLRQISEQVVPSAALSSPPEPIPVATPQYDCAANNPISKSFLDDWSLEHSVETFNFTVVDLVENCTYSFGQPETQFLTASTGKVMVAVATLGLVAAGSLDYAKVESDLTAAIIESDNRAANRLFRLIDENQGIQTVIDDYGLVNTSIGKTWGTIATNSADQALLLDQAIGQLESPLPEAQRVILRELMAAVNPTQDWGAGTGIPDNWTVAVKNGWYLAVPGDTPPVGLWRVNTLGYTWDAKDKPRWIFTGYSNNWKTQERGIFAWDAISNELVATLGNR